MTASDDGDDTVESIEDILERIGEDPATLTVDDLGAVFSEAGGQAVQFAARRFLQSEIDAETADRAVEAVAPALTAPAAPRRAYATAFLADLAVDHPDAVGAAAGSIADRLDDDDPGVREEAVRAAANLSDHRPESAAELLEGVAPFLDSPVADIRMDAAAFVANVARAQPESVAHHIPALLDLVSEEYRGLPEDFETSHPNRMPGMEQIRKEDWETQRAHDRARREAAQGVYHVATMLPGVVADHADRLLAPLDAEDPDDAVRWVIEAIGTVAEHESALGEHAIDGLAELLEEASEDLVGAAAWALGIISEDHQRAVARAVLPSLPALVNHLDGADSAIRARITGLLTYVSEVEPEATAQATGVLVECLSSDNEVVRWGAATTLGYAGTARARAPLEALLEIDENQDVRAAASTALERLQGRTRDPTR